MGKVQTFTMCLIVAVTCSAQLQAGYRGQETTSALRGDWKGKNDQGETVVLTLRPEGRNRLSGQVRINDKLIEFKNGETGGEHFAFSAGKDPASVSYRGEQRGDSIVLTYALRKEGAQIRVLLERIPDFNGSWKTPFDTFLLNVKQQQDRVSGTITNRIQTGHCTQKDVETKIREALIKGSSLTFTIVSPEGARIDYVASFSAGGDAISLTVAGAARSQRLTRGKFRRPAQERVTTCQ
jgi:hypothetical protein